MFWTRTFSGIVLLIILGFVLVSGGPVLSTFLCVISLIGLREYYKAVSLIDDKNITSSVTLPSYLGTIFLYIMVLITNGNITSLVFSVVIVCILVLGVYVFTFPKYRIESIVHVVFGFVYVSVLLCFVYLSRNITNGQYMVWLIFMSSWICDIFAYCVGMLIGKHKLAPVLSPKKSIEGSIGGVVFSALFGLGYGYFLGNKVIADGRIMLITAVVCAVGACVSQVGDLAASAIKRNVEIKDYGHLIPGHGGILDRFDSVMFAAPMVYFVIIVFSQMFGMK